MYKLQSIEDEEEQGRETEETRAGAGRYYRDVSSSDNMSSSYSSSRQGLCTDKGLSSSHYMLLLIWKVGFLNIKIWSPQNIYINLLADFGFYPLEPRIGEVEQTQTSNKSKVRTNLNFEQTQTSNESKFRTNQKVSGLRGT